MSELLFVYGTLQSVFTNPMARLLHEQAHLLGRATAQGGLYDLGDYPGMIRSELAADQVVGEVYEMPANPSLLEQLDQYEGLNEHYPKPWEYTREHITIQLRKVPLTAWAYLYQWSLTNRPRIPHGDYVRWYQG